MASLFQRRLQCFYCGQRSAERKSAKVREWRCKNCEAVNYLDENGDITDPPASVTNVPTDIEQTPFKVLEFNQAGLFCSKCVRNQHMLMNALSSYLPDIDDPEYPAFEQDLPRYQQTMEERYPQVCENCEQRVQKRIRETKYEAKSDHLRRIMERSKASRAIKSARNQNWRHILDVLGFLVYWASVLGQVLSDMMGAVEAGDIILRLFPSPSLVPLISRASRILSWIGYSSQDTATVALIAGVFSIWWNPRLHYKVEGMHGRILGLSQYYECQLIVMAARFGVWALLQDPSRLTPSLPPALHAAMIVFTCLAAFASHRLIQFDARPLVLWSDTPASSPSVSQRQQPRQNKADNLFPQKLFDRFPIERLGVQKSESTRNVVEQPAVPEVQMEDSMDWAPSVSHDIRPRYVTAPTTKAIIPEEPTPSPFFGSLPEQPRPPAWHLRNPIIQKPPPPVPEVNPFHRSPVAVQTSGNKNGNAGPSASDVQFARPKFFPPSDYTAVTGLEGLFDQTFTFKSPGDTANMTESLSISSIDNPFLPSKLKPPRSKHMKASTKEGTKGNFLFPSIRLACLSTCLLIWAVNWLNLAHIPRHWVLMGALVISILFTGFGLLRSLDMAPLRSRRVVFYSVAKFVVTSYLAIHLGLNLPDDSFYQGGYLELSVKVLTGLLAVEESLILLSLYNRTWSRQRRARAQTATSTEPQTQPPSQPPTQPTTQQHAGHGGPLESRPPAINPSKSKTPKSKTSARRPLADKTPATKQLSPASGSSRLFSSTFSSTQLEPSLPALVSPFQQEPADHGHALGQSDVSDDFGDDESYVSEAASSDSDAATTVVSETNSKIRYMNPFVEESPVRRRGLGPGLQGLNLDDGSPRRMTRSQTARGMGTQYQGRRMR
ncbi:Integral inner nuclear membrane protein ima1 [Talaromyces islandicus]|uniref:Integral inner nuclear membrane protein ima1 n=1 Tax=Talaromyces islandicus TaxID=28573 RepID=A0A0U1LS87_TALIS|nr:Integral inner nuclear membrane protein ima1 [Talaromyces islandicus]